MAAIASADRSGSAPGSPMGAARDARALLRRPVRGGGEQPRPPRERRAAADGPGPLVARGRASPRGRDGGRADGGEVRPLPRGRAPDARDPRMRVSRAGASTAARAGPAAPSSASARSRGCRPSTSSPSRPPRSAPPSGPFSPWGSRDGSFASGPWSRFPSSSPTRRGSEVCDGGTGPRPRRFPPVHGSTVVPPRPARRGHRRQRRHRARPGRGARRRRRVRDRGVAASGAGEVRAPHARSGFPGLGGRVRGRPRPRRPAHRPPRPERGRARPLEDGDDGGRPGAALAGELPVQLPPRASAPGTVPPLRAPARRLRRQRGAPPGRPARSAAPRVLVPLREIEGGGGHVLPAPGRAAPRADGARSSRRATSTPRSTGTRAGCTARLERTWSRPRAARPRPRARSWPARPGERARASTGTAGRRARRAGAPRTRRGRTALWRRRSTQLGGPPSRRARAAR